MALEQIVRGPWQPLGTINDKKIVVTRVTKVTTDRAIIAWGSPGSAPETKQTGIRVIVKGVDVKKGFTEKDRKTTDIRVENPDDASQNVNVRRINEIRFSRPKPFADNQSGQPTDVPPGNQKGKLVSPPGAPSQSGLTVPSVISGPGFSDGSLGTTISSTDAGASATPVNGNPNTTLASNAGAVTGAPEKRNEVETFVLKWDDTGSVA